MREASEQAALFERLAYNRKRYPESELLFHIPNGGKRDKREAAYMKKQGVKAGVPDLCLPVARGGFHGLFIELKVGKNEPTEKQRWWLDNLRHRGYAVCVCYSADEAYMQIKEYLNLDKGVRNE